MKRILLLRDGALRAVLVVLGCLVTAGLPCRASGTEPLSSLRFDLGAGPWFVQGKRAVYDENAETVTVTGDVHLVRQDKELRADRIVYYRKLQVAEAIGHVVISTPEGTARGTRLWVDLKQKLGRIEAGELFLRKGHFRIRGDVIQKTGPNRFRLTNSTFTTCNGDPPPWMFHGTEVNLAIDGYARIRSASFRIKGFPVFYVPYLIVPVKVRRQTGFLIPRPEYSSRSGAGLDLPFFWALSEQADATFYEHYLWRRGLKQGVEFRYLASPLSRGTIQFDYLYDHLDDDTFYDDGISRTNTQRWWFRSKQDQELPWGVSLKADLDLASDPDFIREFKSSFSGFDASNRSFESDFHRSLEEDSALFRKSVVNFTRNGTNFGATAGTIYFQDLNRLPEDPTPQQLPTASFTVPDLPLGSTGLFGALDTDYTYFWREDGHKGHRFQVAPRLSLPWEPIHGIVLTPFARIHETGYYIDRGEGEVDSGSTLRSEAVGGMEANATLSRIYDFHFGRLERIRHQVKPMIRYEYRAVDAPCHGPSFDDVETTENENRISYALQNVWTGKFRDKSGTPSYRTLCRLKLSQDYDIRESRRDPQEEGDRRRPFSDLKLELEAYPLRGIQILMDGSWNVYDNELSSFNTYLAARDGRGDRVRMDYRYTTESIEELNAYLLVKITDEFFLFGNGKRSLQGDHTVESAVGALLQFQCWGMEVRFEKQESETRVLVQFTLSGIGEAGPLKAAF